MIREGSQGMSITRFFKTGVGFIAALAVSVIAVGFITPSVGALSSTVSTLKVSPLRTDIEIQPGSSKAVQITVTNLTGDSITVRPIENDFIAGDEKGTPALILDETKFAPTHSLKRFMKPLADVVIPAHQSKTIAVEIIVPKEAQAGGYFGAVRFTSATPDSSGQVNLNPSVASMILLTVPGATVERLQLTDFSIQQHGSAGTVFGSPDDIETSVRFKNEGNVQVGPFGKLSVKQGDKIIYETDFNNKNPRDMILPDSARRWDTPLKKIDNVGYYTVSGTFTYGKENKTVQVEKSFWVIPQTVIIAVIVGIIVLIVMIIGIWLSLRNYKRRILRKHKGGGLGSLKRR